MVSKKPSVFVGSSGKSLAVAQALRDGLSKVANVTLWSEYAEFQRAGKMFLPVLLEQPEKFDFAVMVFGSDVRVETDRGVFEAPRDNVVFELGLFISQLGKDRTFIVILKGQTEVSILTDIQGLIWETCDPSKGTGGVIKKIEGAIRERTKEDSRRTVAAYDGPRDVHGFREALMQEVARRWKRKEHVRVDNFALDMEVTWAPVRDALLTKSTHDLSWRSLMLDPGWLPFRDFQSQTVSVSQAKTNIRNIQSFFKESESSLKPRKITFACRAYRSVPFVHGFLVNDSFLLMTLLKRQKDGKVVALDNSYLRFPARNETNEHTIRAYSDWFNHAWETSQRWVWPSQARS